MSTMRDVLRRRGPTAPAGINYLELTFALFGGAAAWLLRLIVNASLVEYSCLTDATWPVWLATLLTTAVAVLALLAAWRYHRFTGGPDENGARWLALLGLMFNALAIAGILLETSPILFLDVCRSVQRS
jgi:membrane protein implicated in regulation of membrane protease activity